MLTLSNATLHPSGARESGRADIALTKHLKEASALVGVLDQFIVAGSTAVSMAADQGLLSNSPGKPSGLLFSVAHGVGAQPLSAPFGVAGYVALAIRD